jgi:hypothetical protein
MQHPVSVQFSHHGTLMRRRSHFEYYCASDANFCIWNSDFFLRYSLYRLRVLLRRGAVKFITSKLRPSFIDCFATNSTSLTDLVGFSIRFERIRLNPLEIRILRWICPEKGSEESGSNRIDNRETRFCLIWQMNLTFLIGFYRIFLNPIEHSTWLNYFREESLTCDFLPNIGRPTRKSLSLYFLRVTWITNRKKIKRDYFVFF